jgi:hypothetical protein
LFESCAQALSVKGAGLRQEGEIRQILHPRVLPLAWEGIGVQFLGDVGLSRVDAQPRARNAREGEEVTPLDDFGSSYEHISEGGIYPEGIAVGLACQLSLHTESTSLVHHAFAVDDVSMRSNPYVEEEMVPRITPASFLKLLQQDFWPPGATKIHVLGRAGSHESQFEDDAPLQYGRIPKNRENAHEEPVEDELLA